MNETIKKNINEAIDSGKTLECQICAVQSEDGRLLGAIRLHDPLDLWNRFVITNEYKPVQISSDHRDKLIAEHDRRVDVGGRFLSILKGASPEDKLNRIIYFIQLRDNEHAAGSLLVRVTEKMESSGKNWVSDQFYFLHGLELALNPDGSFRLVKAKKPYSVEINERANAL